MSGLVKGVKKVFSAIGNAVKKIMKSPIFKALLIAAAVIFTGGAALGAFAAMGTAGATFGSVMAAGLSAGAAPFSAALGALTGAASSVGSALGIGTAAAEGTAAVGAAGVVEGGTMAAAAAEAAAPGAASWLAPAADTAGLFGETVAGGAAASEGAAGLAAQGGTDAMGTYAAQAGADGAASWAAPTVSQTAAQPFNLANVAPEALNGAPPINAGVGSTAPGGGYASASYTPMEADFVGTKALTGNTGGKSLWDFLKPALSSKEGQLLIGQTLMGAGNGIMQGRAA